MNKLKMQTANLVNKNFEVLSRLFPNAVTESLDENGNVVRAIDADILRQEISCDVVEGREERYQFTWPDKKKSIAVANEPTNMTLRPIIEKSEKFDNTNNLYIEGDNIYVLKILQESYLGKIRMIYIDPPYNTGKDSFVYNDSFLQSSVDFASDSGQRDEDGNILFDMRNNNESNGRFHTDWLNMMYPRLKLARNLLRDDGVIFISIDDHEVDNMKKMCNEVFGEQNFVATIVWQRAYAPVNLNKWFSPNHDFALVYAKELDKFDLTKLPRTEKQNKDYKNPDNDPRGPWKAGNPSVGPAVESNIYEITLPSGRKVLPPAGRSWLYSEKKYKEMVADNRISFGKDGDSVWAPKMFLSEVSNGVTPMTLWTYEEVGHSQDATKQLKQLFDDNSVFDYSKPVEYIKRMVQIGTRKNEEDIVLDFFSGSSTTAHAVMKLNAEDHGNRRFIMVQLPEEVDDKKLNYKNICEIGTDRIKRAAQKIKEEIGEEFDSGFRYLKLDSSNMRDVYYNPAEVYQTSILDMVDNIKEGRSSLDLLFQVMIELNVPLTSRVEKRIIAQKEVFWVEDGYMIACLEENVNEDIVKAIAEKKPYYAVFRDSSMFNDSVATNFDQIFASISPDTVRKVL
ncbi:site-specific DNA-methyltransferase [Lachnobacterium bovis]|uniref:site-specific DNA-methyltransferase n=1 Tax=Lachnobacterium bovis TaxID=140626 RepID=UPI0003B662A3|nr:site-specific DNA-methyltransferase [Lachnobacterium bovis]